MKGRRGKIATSSRIGRTQNWQLGSACLVGWSPLLVDEQVSAFESSSCRTPSYPIKEEADKKTEAVSIYLFKQAIKKSQKERSENRLGRNRVTKKSIHPMRCHLIYMQDRLQVGLTGSQLLLVVRKSPLFHVYHVQRWRKCYLRFGAFGYAMSSKPQLLYSKSKQNRNISRCHFSDRSGTPANTTYQSSGGLLHLCFMLRLPTLFSSEFALAGLKTREENPWNLSAYSLAWHDKLQLQQDTKDLWVKCRGRSRVVGQSNVASLQTDSTLAT